MTDLPGPEWFPDLQGNTPSTGMQGCEHARNEREDTGKNMDQTGISRLRQGGGGSDRGRGISL